MFCCFHNKRGRSGAITYTFPPINQSVTFFLMKIPQIIVPILILLLSNHLVLAQVKIGDNLQTIDGSSLLELESTNRAFVLTRVTQDEMDAIIPLHGALVYNTDMQCVFMYDGNQWESLCNQGINITESDVMPVTNLEGDIWIDTSTNSVGIWNGTSFILIDKNPYRGSGTPSTMLIDNPLPGDLYVDITSGDLYTFNGTQWSIQGNGIQATNGITETETNAIELGGTLTKPTTIITDNTNTLSLQGLEISNATSNLVVVLDAPTGVLSTTTIPTLVQREQAVIVANHGQNQFSTPYPIIDGKKIDVYRNGVRIDFTVVDNNTIELAPDATCFQNDEIRIIQFF